MQRFTWTQVQSLLGNAFFFTNNSLIHRPIEVPFLFIKQHVLRLFQIWIVHFYNVWSIKYVRLKINLKSLESILVGSTKNVIHSGYDDGCVYKYFKKLIKYWYDLNLFCKVFQEKIKLKKSHHFGPTWPIISFFLLQMIHFITFKILLLIYVK